MATRNQGKILELRQLLVATVDVELVDLEEAGVQLEVPETATTFAQNATLKALGYAEASGMLTLADDSGLEVDALDGAPGVHTARYGGPGLTHEERYLRLLEELRGVEWEARTARFWAVTALARPGELLGTARGKCEGMIALRPAGKYGFGYDPVFYLPELDKTMAQLTPDEKQVLSHRARAIAATLPLLKRMLAQQEDAPDK